MRKKLASTPEHPVEPTFEIEIIAKDGKKIPLEVSIQIQYRGGKVASAEGIARDISERKRLEEELWRSQRMDAIGRLAAGVAHDFSNTLTTIMGYCDLMAGRLEATDPRRLEIEEIKSAADRSSDLCRQLMAFSRRQVMEPRILDMSALLADMSKMLKKLVGEHVDVTITTGKNLGYVRADSAQIEQVLINLASNAREAMPRGGKLNIELANVDLDEAYARTHLDARPGPYVMIAVSDTGGGIDPALRSQIFEPFISSDSSGKHAGLGLSSVYGIVKQSNGHIWLDSEPGRGATFRVYLPRVERGPEAPEAAEESVKSLRGNETILVVEDEDQVRHLVRAMLESYGYTVLDAPNARDALTVCGKHSGPIDLLLTDVVMPGMSGRALVTLLSGLRLEIPVLYMSGYPDSTLASQRILEPGHDFLQKPITHVSLCRKVRSVLDKGKSVAQ